MTILSYHSIDTTWESPLVVAPTVFAQHCEWLAKRRNVVSLAAATSMIERNGKLDRGAVVITFDDGFADLYEHAFPVLKRLGLPSTVFLVGDTLHPPVQAVNWVDTAPDFPLQTLSADQIVEMSQNGVTFESHSLHHLDLTTLSAEECEADLRKSKELIEDLTRLPVQFLAYPRGFHNATVRDAAKRAGYRAAFALPEGHESEGMYSLPRVGVFPGNAGLSFAMKTSPRYVALRTSSVYPRIRQIIKGEKPPVHTPSNPDA